MPAPKEKERTPDERPEPTPEEIERWPTAAKVAAQLQLSPRRIHQMVRAGDFAPIRDSRGVQRFDPEEVDTLTPSATTINAHANVIELLNSAVKIQSEANESLLRLLPTPMLAVIEKQNATIDRLMNRIEVLEADRIKMIEVYEKSLTDQHTRELDRFKVEREQGRKDKALEELSKIVPVAVEQWQLGADLSKFLKAVDPNLLEALADDGSDMLPEDQRALLKSVLAKVRAMQKRATETDTKPTEETNGKPD